VYLVFRFKQLYVLFTFWCKVLYCPRSENSVLVLKVALYIHHIIYLVMKVAFYIHHIIYLVLKVALYIHHIIYLVLKVTLYIYHIIYLVLKVALYIHIYLYISKSHQGNISTSLLYSLKFQVAMKFVKKHSSLDLKEL